MKIRTGFVSNSSSSSFSIQLDDLSARQLQKIQDHHKEISEDSMDNAWAITVGSVVHGSTFMDNFDMRDYLENIGIDMDKVEWGY